MMRSRRLHLARVLSVTALPKVLTLLDGYCNGAMTASKILYMATEKEAKLRLQQWVRVE